MNSGPAVRVGRRRTLFVAGSGLVGAFALVAVFWRPGLGPFAAGEKPLIVRARSALDRERYDRAEKLASRIPQDDGSWADGRLVAGEAATRAGRLQAAVEHYRAVPRDGSKTAILAAFSLGEVYRELGRLSDAEREYAYVLEHRPDDAPTHQRLAFLLGVTGRGWQAREHFLFLVRHRAWTLDSLALLGDLQRPMEEGDYLRRCADNAPDDILVQLGLATHAFLVEGRSSEARRRLRRVLASEPGIVAAHAMLGELLVDAGGKSFLDWHAGLPAEADRHPDIWFVRGLRARRRQKLRVAARCFWETVRRAPAHRRGNYQLGQVLVSLGERRRGEAFLERARRKFEVTEALDDVLKSRGRDRDALRQITRLMEEMGHLWEAWAWGMTAARFFPSADWPKKAVARIGPRLNENTPRIIDSANLALKYDFSGFPDHERLLAQAELPNYRESEGQHDVPADERPESIRSSSADAPSSIRFEDVSQRKGIDFVYYNSPDPSTEGVRIFEQNGGGVAVLDFDSDRRADLYFTQGAHWEHGDDAPEPSDRYRNRLYRNAGGTFAEITSETRLGDRGYGQGCSAGDFNNDGFADLYVANIGRNRLYVNNGDGTFSDVTERAGLRGNDWTASCVVADLNADGWPDLYDANYLQGENLYQTICDGKACSPTVYGGAPDRLYVNRGDGTFTFLAEAAPESNGKGLGLLAAQIPSSRSTDEQARSPTPDNGRLSLFVANDQVANFFLRSRPSDDPYSVRLKETAFASGLAFNEHGLPLACMGIAADDADGNGRLDFFVTNFADESNTLYLQQARGLFTDATGPAGLKSPSWPYVGWGTQFLDADRDGHPDLVVANGHVDDYRDEGGEYHMRPQFLRNSGSGRFVEIPAEEAGDYFERKYLGRGLARLDWDRDGRMDFAVSHIGDRAALVANRTRNSGRFLNVRLHATSTARDAIGSIVEVAAERGRWRKQLTAGDGYMASNERLLQFGLGASASVKSLRVNWPSGKRTTLHDLPVDATIELVEGAPYAVVWDGTESELLAVP